MRTYSEPIRAYLSALKTGKLSTEYDDLPRAAPEEWPVLEDALSSQASNRRILVLPEWRRSCPKCYRTLPRVEESKLRTVGIATAKNCCQRILLYPGA